MTTKLSVNLNKIALIRNSRDTRIPSVTDAAKVAIDAGAEGITVHPRPDERHIRPSDVNALAGLLSQAGYKDIEFNIEGNPYAGPSGTYPGFLQLVEEFRPHQVTLVPDNPTQLTSDHGWDLCGMRKDDTESLKSIIKQLDQQNMRVSLFMDPDALQIQACAQLGAHRIEFYTGPYADAFPAHEAILVPFTETAYLAKSLGLGINAGHDLNLENLQVFCEQVPNLAEVSIGHAIITDALWMGLATAVGKYRDVLDQCKPKTI